MFTICIPVRNGARSIDSAVSSALSQTFKGDYEVLISNNHSTDDTSVILKKWEGHPRLRVLVPPAPLAMYGNHNYCLQEARMPYVVFCHADDSLAPFSLTVFEHIVAGRSYPPNFVCWGRSSFRDFKLNLSRAGSSVGTMISGEFAFLPFVSGGLTPSGTMFSRESFLAEGGFLDFPSRCSASDMATMLLLGLRGFEFLMIDRLVLRRFYASTARNFTVREVRSFHFEAFEALEARIGRAPFVRWAELLRMGYLGTNITELEFYLWEKKVIASTELIRRAFKRNPIGAFKFLV